MRKLSRYLIQGVILTVPLGITVYAIVSVFGFFSRLIPRSIVVEYVPESLIPIVVPLVSILLLLVFLVGVGFVGNSVIAQPIMNAFNRVINKIPLIKLLYSSVKDLMGAFVGKKKSFNVPVAVKLNNETELYKLGFVTREDTQELGLKKDLVAVYLPHSYNFSGNLFLISTKNIIYLENEEASELMKFVVSGGVSGFRK